MCFFNFPDVGLHIRPLGVSATHRAFWVQLPPSIFSQLQWTSSSHREGGMQDLEGPIPFLRREAMLRADSAVILQPNHRNRLRSWSGGLDLGGRPVLRLDHLDRLDLAPQSDCQNRRIAARPGRKTPSGRKGSRRIRWAVQERGQPARHERAAGLPARHERSAGLPARHGRSAVGSALLPPPSSAC